MFPILLAQETSADSSSLVPALIQLGLVILAIVGMWGTFVKANKPGWASIVPIYNGIVLLGIAGKPWWWIILAIIPIVNLIMLTIPFEIASKFGKGIGFGLGLLFLPFIFYPILAFGDAQYQG